MKVFIQQPVIPKYRVPLFNALTKNEAFDLEVHASKSISGMPSSADESLYEFNFIQHECELKINGSIYKQKAMKLSSDYKEGDVLVYNSNPRFISNRALVNQAKKRGMRLIAWNHANSSTSSGIKSWLRKKITASKADDLLLYTSDEVTPMLEEGWERENLYYLNNTINEKEIFECLTSFSNEESVKSAKKSARILAFKKEHSLEDKKVFLFCGRLTEKSELNLLIEALGKCTAKERDDLLFIIIGDGQQLGAYKQQAEDCGLTKNFLWLGSIYEEVKLAPWFLSADYFIYPGAIGLSVNHAMSYGLPVITHNNRQKQMPEFSYIKDGANGLLYEYQSIESLRSTILKAVSKASIKIDDVLHSAYQDFSFDRMISRFNSCLLRDELE